MRFRARCVACLLVFVRFLMGRGVQCVNSFSGDIWSSSSSSSSALTRALDMWAKAVNGGKKCKDTPGIQYLANMCQPLRARFLLPIYPQRGDF